MPTSERRQRGFGYLLLLFALLLGSAGLAAIGESWQVATQREREAELLFRGNEIRNALLSYRAVDASGIDRYPASLRELLEDRRQDPVRHHLRRLYLDPFTGTTDWALLRDKAGRIVGVHSRAHLRALRQHSVPAQPPLRAEGAGTRADTVGDWWFTVEDPVAPGP